MDDLAAELELRGSEPPYEVVKQELAARFAAIEEVEQTEVGKQFARQIALFMRERHRMLQ